MQDACEPGPGIQQRFAKSSPSEPFVGIGIAFLDPSFGNLVLPSREPLALVWSIRQEEVNHRDEEDTGNTLDDCKFSS